jgi:hypothetical protein
MSSGLKVRARREATDKSTCDHYACHVWVYVIGPKQREMYRARCLGCEVLGPVVYEGPLAARQALRDMSSQAG